MGEVIMTYSPAMQRHHEMKVAKVPHVTVTPSTKYPGFLRFGSYCGAASIAPRGPNLDYFWDMGDGPNNGRTFTPGAALAMCERLTALGLPLLWFGALEGAKHEALSGALD